VWYVVTVSVINVFQIDVRVMSVACVLIIMITYVSYEGSGCSTAKGFLIQMETNFGSTEGNSKSHEPQYPNQAQLCTTDVKVIIIDIINNIIVVICFGATAQRGPRPPHS
jgi:hypothetical protein